MSPSPTMAHAFGPGLRTGCPGVRSILRGLLGVLVILAGQTIPVRGIRAQDESAPSVEITAQHPLTGAELSAETPHPVRGVPGDGLPDRIPYAIIVRWERRSSRQYESLAEAENDARRVLASLEVELRVGDGADLTVEPAFYPITYPLNRDVSSVYAGKGEVALPSDLTPEQIVDFMLVLYQDGVPVDTFTTEIRPGMPELRFRSTIISDNMGDTEGLRLTGTASGRTGLEFAEDYLTLSGRGEVEYEDFQIEFRADNPMQNCTIATSTRDGYFRAVQVVLFTDSLPPPAPSPDTGADLAPNDVVFALEPGIGESATISCPGSPVNFPLPEVLHFFAGFYSIHGGEVDGQPNEMDEGRGGLVIDGWESGEGDVIATRTYSRRGSIGPGTLIEETVLELRWVN